MRTMEARGPERHDLGQKFLLRGSVVYKLCVSERPRAL